MDVSEVKDAPLTEEELELCGTLRTVFFGGRYVPIARLVTEARRLRAFEVFVREQFHDCPAHGQATKKYPCPPGCLWPKP